MGRFGPLEFIVILVIALVIFGPSKLPEVGKAIGKGIREFKKETSSLMGDEDENKEKPANKEEDHDKDA